MLATSVDPDKLSARLDELEAITYKSYEYGRAGTSVRSGVGQGLDSGL